MKFDKSSVQIISVCLGWYCISSIGSQVTKEILSQCPLPLFLGEFQFLYTALLAVLTSLIAFTIPKFHNSFPKGTFPEHYKLSKQSSLSSVITTPTKHIIMTVLPLGVFQFVGKYFGHKATSLVPISTVSSIKTLSPVFIIIIQKIFKYKCKVTPSILFSLFCIISGVYAIVSFDSDYIKKSKTVASDKNMANSNTNFTSGIIAATVSMLIFVCQNIYGKKVFTFEEKPDQETKGTLPVFQNPNQWVPKQSSSSLGGYKKYDKMTLMIYISILGFCSSFAWFVTLELPLIWRQTKFDNMITDAVIIPWKLLFVNGTLHFIQAMIAYYLLGQISTLSYSIANLMKRIVIIVFSWTILSSASFNFTQFLGLFLNALGLFLYSRYK